MPTETQETGEKAKLSSSAHNFPIVGIGASAGGLDAFKQMLEAIPVDSAMAYVVVQHLNPAHHSNLTEILSRVTKIPIEEITDEVIILPNHIYVMPSGKILTSVDGFLKLTPRENIKTNLVIDVFFTSLAVVWESMAVGVVLSGTGADGTAGLKKIKEYGGTTIVQDESAAYGDMPQSAVDANVVDFVLPAGKIPAQLLKLNNDSAITQTNEEEELLLQSDEVVYKQMLQLLLQRSGVDFSYYKQSTVRRRIGRRMAMHKRGNLADYLKFLSSDKNAQDALFQDMLISVTSFFRDPKMYDTLLEKVLPELLKSKPPEDTIRIWIAGCATGEETYSIAICLHEYLTISKGQGNFLNPLSGGRGAIQIFASDISETAIDKARAGIYTKADVQPVSEKRLSNYFIKTDGGYQVNKVVRDMCVFARHNFLKDPPFAKIDLISCRNVLIYMESFLQKKALTTFHYALKENGTLLLGKSETVVAASELFTSSDKRLKIYSRRPGEGRIMQVATGRREETLTTQNTEAKNEFPQSDFRNNADAILLSRAPAAVVINAEMDIVHIHGDIEPFLKHSPGKPSLNLLKMAREQLAIELRNAIYKVKLSKDSVIKAEITTYPHVGGGDSGSASSVSIEVIPLADTVEPHYLILFTKIHFSSKEDILNSPKGGRGSVIKRNKDLEKELAHTREDVISIREEMEATIEELQTTNEELQNSIEELQSLNEELETSGEELQSSNEELTIVNQELIDKEHLLNAARDYSEAIISTIKQPLLVLDRSLCIKSANNSFYKKFTITKTETEGRLFYKLQNDWWNSTELRTLLERILPQKSRMEDFEMIVDEKIMLLNAREILSEKNTEQLILLAIDDVTDSRLAKKLKESEARLASERQVLYNSFMNAPAGIAILKGNTHIYEFANDTYEKLVGKTIVIGNTVQEHFPEIEEQGYIEMLNTVFSTGEAFINNEIPIELNIKGDGILEKLFLKLVVQPLKHENGNTDRMMVHALDITEAVNARKLIEERETFNRTVLESSPDCLKVLDIEGRIQYMNFNGLCQMEIDDFSTIKNKNWWTLWGTENEALVKASIDKALTGTTAKFTALCTTIKGTPKWWDVVISPVSKLGEPVQQIISVSRDVTEKRKAEEAIEKMATHLKLATDSANVGTWSLTLKTQKLEWSAVHKKIWGYDEHRIDLTYEDWHKQILPEDKAKAFERIENAKINHSYYEAEYQINKADDNLARWMKSTGQYYYDDHGEAKTLTGITVDITQQKESELKLKASEEKYRGIFETMDQGFSIIEMIFDSDNKPVDCVYIETNPVFEKQTGLKNVTGKTARELIPNLEQHWFQIYGNVALTGEPNRFIEGSEALGRWFETSAFRLGDEGSKKVAVLFTDITERKKNEETLRYRKALLEAHNEANRDGLILVDARGKIISYNKSFIDIWRMSKDIVDSKDDDRALAFAMSRLVNPQQFIDKVKWLYEHPSETSVDELEYLDGRIVERHGYSVLGDDGTYYAWAWTFRDITEQKAAAAAIIESETRFRNMAEATEVLIGVADEKSNVTYFNKAWVGLTGRPMKDLLKLGWADLLHPDDKDRVINIYLSAFAKQADYTVEFRILNKTGEYRWLLAKVPARFHPDGTFAGYISASVDITEQKSFTEELEEKVKSRTEELQSKNIQLENANAELSSFNYIASHDLQEPLRKIQTFSRLIIQSQKFEDKTLNYFNRIIAAGERMQNLIVSLLDFSRISALELIYECCDLNAIVEESKDDLQLSIIEKKALIEYGNLPTINGSHIQLSQLFTNLIDNGIKYSRPEIKPHITITATIIEGKTIEHPLASLKDYHAIKIADNGIGFEPEYADKIFEIFQRLHGKNEYSGTGIGLAIVKKIVTSHSGFIVAEGVFGVGSTFTVYIPTT